MITNERAERIYRDMLRIRGFELKALSMFEQNILRGSVHLYVGEEAIAATICSLLSNEDYIASTHRGHGHCIAKGARLDKAMAELMGKATGYCKGRSGSMHIADFEVGNLGANAIVGGGVPIAVGAGLSIKMQKKQNVAVAFYGDSASNEGTVHEAMNLASIWKLPVIFVCENNGYGISVPSWQSTSVENISDRAVGYNMPGYSIDGNDVEIVNETMEKAIERALAGDGPTLIECKTYRWLGHWTGDPQVYRTREEVERWKLKDPVKRYADKLIANNILTAAQLEEIQKEVDAEVEEAAAFALSSPEPDPAHVTDDVFYEGEVQ